MVRAFLVVLLIALPSLLVPGMSGDVTQIVALLCLFAGGLTFFEYSAPCPGLVEFRDAPPFNRIRFCAAFLTVLMLSLICKVQVAPDTTALFAQAVGTVMAHATDFPYSPVNLFVDMLPAGTDPAIAHVVRISAGTAYLLSLMSLAVFALAAQLRTWPSGKGAFNIWVNLPTFDPTAGGDMVDRLGREARFNIALGFGLPFVMPVLFRASAVLFGPVTLDNTHTLIWTISAWALLPASLFMRGLALGRIAGLIRDQRRRAVPAGAGAFVPG